MSYHDKISNNVSLFLNNIYYNYLIKIYKNQMNNILNSKEKFIIKLEYLIYLQYYFIYTFFYYITNKNKLLYSISLHSIYICDLTFKNLSKKYDYTAKNNNLILIDTSYLLFLYLFFFKIIFLKIYFQYKIGFFISSALFYLLMTVNDIYNKRLECINLNKDFYHPLKIIILSPNKKFIMNIINKTKLFTYSNFLLFINIFLLFII
jgi:hypothetical protein